MSLSSFLKKGCTGFTHALVNGGGKTLHVQKLGSFVQLEPLARRRNLDFVVSVNLSFQAILPLPYVVDLLILLLSSFIRGGFGWKGKWE